MEGVYMPIKTKTAWNTYYNNVCKYGVCMYVCMHV